MTAVEWLVDQFETYFENKVYIEKPDLIKILEQAKEIEKQQGYSEEDLKNAFLDGWELRDGNLPFTKAKNKWFEQFKKK